MRAGRLHRRVTIQEKVTTRDAYGAEVVAWGDLATVWAAVEPLRGREFLEQARDGAEVTTRIVLRYQGLTAIRPEMRVVHPTELGDQVYDVLSVIHVDERRREYQLLCRQLIQGASCG